LYKQAGVPLPSTEPGSSNKQFCDNYPNPPFASEQSCYYDEYQSTIQYPQRNEITFQTMSYTPDRNPSPNKQYYLSQDGAVYPGNASV